MGGPRLVRHVIQLAIHVAMAVAIIASHVFLLGKFIPTLMDQTPVKFV